MLGLLVPGVGMGGGSAGGGATLVYGPIFAPAATLYLPGASFADVAIFGAMEADVFIPGAGE